jgi:hypothetical protein
VPLAPTLGDCLEQVKFGPLHWQRNVAAEVKGSQPRIVEHVLVLPLGHEKVILRTSRNRQGATEP